MVLTLSFLKMLLTPEVSLCSSLSRKLETAQHANIGTSVRAVFFFLLDMISDMGTVSVGHPVFLLDMLFTLFRHLSLCTHPLLRFLISFGYTHEALERNVPLCRSGSRTLTTLIMNSL